MILRTALCLALLTTGAAHAQSWSVTGPKGGTGSGSASCTQDGSSNVCERTGSYTGAAGNTRSWGKSRVATADGVTVEGSATRPRGTQTWSRTRTR